VQRKRHATHDGRGLALAPGTHRADPHVLVRRELDDCGKPLLRRRHQRATEDIGRHDQPQIHGRIAVDDVESIERDPAMTKLRRSRIPARRTDVGRNDGALLVERALRQHPRAPWCGERRMRVAGNYRPIECVDDVTATIILQQPLGVRATDGARGDTSAVLDAEMEVGRRLGLRIRPEERGSTRHDAQARHRPTSTDRPSVSSACSDA
jgi:hypothetical protein